jgi:hypothetical protein
MKILGSDLLRLVLTVAFIVVIALEIHASNELAHQEEAQTDLLAAQLGYLHYQENPAGWYNEHYGPIPISTMTYTAVDANTSYGSTMIVGPDVVTVLDVNSTYCPSQNTTYASMEPGTPVYQYALGICEHHGRPSVEEVLCTGIPHQNQVQIACGR